MKNSILSLLCLIVVHSVNAQKLALSDVDLNLLVSETQQMSNENKSLNLYWWIPIEFWKASFSKDATLTQNEVKEFIAPLEGFTLMAVVEGKIGVYGTMSYVSAESLRQNVRMISIDSTLYKPIAEKELSDEMMVLLGILKPMLTNMLGEMGSNINFFVFPNKDKKGDRIFSPYVANSVRASNQSKLYKWRTPLSSLLPKKKCPVDEELLNGTWSFCPFHGNKLVNQ